MRLLGQFGLKIIYILSVNLARVGADIEMMLRVVRSGLRIPAPTKYFVLVFKLSPCFNCNMFLFW